MTKSSVVLLFFICLIMATLVQVTNVPTYVCSNTETRMQIWYSLRATIGHHSSQQWRLASINMVIVMKTVSAVRPQPGILPPL